MKLADAAAAKNLKTGVGLMSRHSRALQELHFIETPEVDVPAGQLRFAQEVRLELTAGITRIEPPTVRVTIEQLQPGEH